MNPQDCIFFHLTTASKKAGRYWKDQVAPFGVTGVQAMVLNFLLEEDQISSIKLSKRTSLDSATLTGILDRLESIKLISRQAYAGDRRAISVCLTERGREIAESTWNMIETANQSYLKNLSKEETLILKSLLSKI